MRILGISHDTPYRVLVTVDSPREFNVEDAHLIMTVVGSVAAALGGLIALGRYIFTRIKRIEFRIERTDERADVAEKRADSAQEKAEVADSKADLAASKAEKAIKTSYRAWGAIMKRGELEATTAGFLTPGGQPTIKAKEAFAFMAPDLARWYQEEGYGMEPRDLYLALEEKFVDDLIEKICKPYGLRQMACVHVAALIAQGTTMMFSPTLPTPEGN